MQFEIPKIKERRSMNEGKEKEVIFQTHRVDPCENLPSSHKTKPKATILNIRVQVKETEQTYEN